MKHVRKNYRHIFATICISFAFALTSAKAQILNHSQIPSKKITFKYTNSVAFANSKKQVDTFPAILVCTLCNPNDKTTKTLSMFGYIIEKKDAGGTIYLSGYLDDNKRSLPDNVFVWFNQEYQITL